MLSGFRKVVSKDMPCKYGDAKYIEYINDSTGHIIKELRGKKTNDLYELEFGKNPNINIQPTYDIQLVIRDWNKGVKVNNINIDLYKIQGVYTYDELYMINNILKNTLKLTDTLEKYYDPLIRRDLKKEELKIKKGFKRDGESINDKGEKIRKFLDSGRGYLVYEILDRVTNELTDMVIVQKRGVIPIGAKFIQKEDKRVLQDFYVNIDFFGSSPSYVYTSSAYNWYKKIGITLEVLQLLRNKYKRV